MTTQILDELICPPDFNQCVNYLDLVELAVTANRPEIFKIFLNEFCDVVDEFLKPSCLYFLYNFKNGVCLFQISEKFYSKFYKYFFQIKKEEDVRDAPFSVLFKRKNEKFFSFEFIKDKLEELIGVDLREDFFSDDKQANEHHQNFNLEKVLYSYTDPIFPG